MKTQSLSTLVALASGIQLAAATGWLDAPAFQCPGNSDNHCNNDQSHGFDWSGLSTGSFNNYGGFNFDNWHCSDSFGPSKRGLGGNGNGFQSKCITGVASPDHSSCPSFGCGSDSGVPDFSVDHFQVSVEFDCNLDFHYGMPDGSTCKQTSPCSKGGSTIKNTQCGGAKNVTVVYPGGGPKPTCSVGVHSIGFDCSSHSTRTYSATTMPQYPTSTYVPSYPTTTSVSAPETTATTPVYSASTQSSASTVVTATIYTTSVETVTSCAPTVTNCPGSSTVVTTVTYPVSTTVTTVSTAQGVTYTQTTTASVVVPPYSIYNTSSTAGGVTSSSEVYTTVVVDTTTTVCPFTSTHVSGGTTSIETGTTTSTILITSYSTVSPSATVPYATNSASPLPYPSILPQCLNTWIPMDSDCNSNTASDCYCPSETLVCSVYECLYAHGATDSDIASAQNYFKGICVNQIGSNPAILSCSSEVSGATTYPAGPVTTVTVESTVVVPCSESGTVIPYSSTTTVVTTSVIVPQVVLTTVPGPASTVALVTGTPAPASYPAQTYPVPTTIASVTVPGPSNTVGLTQPSFTNSAAQTGLGFSGLLAAAIFIAAFAL